MTTKEQISTHPLTRAFISQMSVVERGVLHD